MPAKNVQKTYVENTYYHLYNRGIEKRTIFLDEQDYGVFLSYLKQYLLPKDEKGLTNSLTNPNTSYREKDRILKLLRLNNFSEEMTLLAYCLMSNHFHFLIYQKNPNSIDKFMNSLGTRYTMYFNKKYKRVGKLCQGNYKAVMVIREEQFLHLTRYIHKQALALQGVAWERSESQPCSYPEYNGERKSEWIHPEEVLNYFSKTNPKFSYEAFVKQQEEDLTIIGKLTLDED